MLQATACLGLVRVVMAENEQNTMRPPCSEWCAWYDYLSWPTSSPSTSMTRYPRVMSARLNGPEPYTVCMSRV